ncbi:MAG: DUF1501 domain-containing protein [Cyanobacteria bacterium P01_F01_bin.3]
MKRRQFLQTAALAGASGVAAVGAHGWLWRSSAQAATVPRLIVVMLRGATDGLNIVVPYRENVYYQERPSIAIAKPGENNGALDLDGQFGLHPSLDALMPEWEDGNLAFVHAAGFAQSSRSHFQAQDYLETATPGETSTRDGWLNRLLAVLPDGTPAQGVNMGTGSVLPLIFAGSESVSNVGVNRAGNARVANEPRALQNAFDQLYARNDRLGEAYQEGRAARDVIRRELEAEGMEASRGAPTPERFSNTARSLARLMKGDTGTQVAFMQLGGWDTHVNERGTLNRLLRPLGNGLAALAKELGPLYQDTTIVVMSEFGRTIAENGNGGTDHGHGSAMWVMGGGVRGRQVHGQWPGLNEANQHQGRDLAVTTDFRDVLSAVLTQQFNLDAGAIAQVFPGYQARNSLRLV